MNCESIPESAPEGSAARPLAHPRITVIGVGNAGCHAVERMARNGLESVRLVVVSTNAQVLTRVEVPEKWVLAGRLRYGLGTGGDAEQGRAAAEADREALRGFCEGADIVFVVAGLGGGTGGGAAPVIAQLAKETGALVLSVAMLPFDWEGVRRKEQAEEALGWLKSRADSVICISNQRLFKLIDESTGVMETFDIINSFVEEAVRSIWRLLTQRSLIHVDFADLCAVTRGRHSQSSLAAMEAAGVNRVPELVDKLLSHPLLDGGVALAEADALLVSIVGGPDLTMTEVGRVTERIRRQSELAHLIVGAAVDERMGDRLHVTVVASRPQPAGVVGSSLAEGDDGMVRLTQESIDGSGARFRGHGMGRESVSEQEWASAVGPSQGERLFRESEQGRGGPPGMKRPRMQQGMLPLDIISKGRFEKSEPTLFRGEDLDVPTYIRRGVALN
jgi:cell division protein FtsZ